MKAEIATVEFVSLYPAGAQLDVWLANRAGLSDVHFSRALVLKRYHRKVTIWKTLSYRWQLIRVSACSCAAPGYTRPKVLFREKHCLSMPSTIQVFMMNFWNFWNDGFLTGFHRLQSFVLNNNSASERNLFGFLLGTYLLHCQFAAA